MSAVSETESGGGAEVSLGLRESDAMVMVGGPSPSILVRPSLFATVAAGGASSPRTRRVAEGMVDFDCNELYE